MSFRWDFELSRTSQAHLSDLEDAGFLLDFPTQADAESWLGQHYPDLQDYGVAQVSLREQERVVYGPMGLADPE